MSSTEMHEIEKKKRKGSDSSSSTSKRSENRSPGPDEPEETDDPEVRFIQPNHAENDVKLDVGAPTVQFSGLTKDELMKFADDPFWKKVRWVLFVLFWILWAAMLIAAILIIVFTPKCPKVPKQKFWQKASGYHLDVANFKDTDGNGVGDISGVISNVDYLKKTSGFVVMSSIIKGSLGTDKVRSTGITNFFDVDPLVGKLGDIKKLMKECRKKSLKTLIEFHPHTGKKHEWFTKADGGDKKYKNYYIWSTKSQTSKMVNRVGEGVWNKAKSEYYWSSLHSSLPALNLSNSMVLEELKGAVQFWLNQGFDGIFIDNAAFLAPNTKASPGNGLTVTGTDTLLKWYSTGHNGQLHTEESIYFIEKVRRWVDEVEKKTDRERLLLVSSGNTGLKQDQGKTLAYLGEPSAPGAHSVVLYDLVPSQGAKVSGKDASANMRQLVDQIVGVDNGTVTLVTQTMSGPRNTDATLSFMNLLLPSTALSLYGEEIGMSAYKSIEPKMYPKVKFWYITQAALKNAVLKDDLIDSYNVPMQWTGSGGFSKLNITNPMKFPDKNVMSLSPIGRGTTRLDVFFKLNEIRKEPSLNWGKMKWIEINEGTPKYYIFTRSAEGFPKILVALIGSKKDGGLARDFSKVCEKATVLLHYPENDEFKAKGGLPMKNIYLRYLKKTGGLYVFKCNK